MRARVLLREALCALAALGIAALVALHVAVSARSFLVYLDGDSMLLSLMRASRAAGQAQDWVLSSPLFLPETALSLLLGALRLPEHTAITVTGLVNWVVLYAALRFVAGAVHLRGLARRVRLDRGPADRGPADRGPGTPWAPLAALAATAVVGAMALLESSPDRNALDDASLLSTGTYYSATVVGTVVVVGLLARLWGAPRHPRALLGVTAAVAAVSALSNPLFLVWVTVPAVVAAALLVAGARMRGVVPAVVALVAGSAAGMLGRIPFAPILLQDPSSRVVPGRAGESARYYAGLAADLARTWQGQLELALVLGSLAVGVAVTVRGLRRADGATDPDRAALVLGVLSWLLPAVVVVEVVATGTLAARYLQPVFFAPPLALVAAARVLAPATSSRAVLLTRAAVLAVPLLVVAAVAPGALVPSPSTAADLRSVACVDRFVEHSGRIGAGQYWTVRAPKSYLARPRQLLQVDPDLNPYIWLIDRADYRGVDRVSFVVDSADSPPTRVHAPSGITPAIIRCGRYTITDYGAPVLPLGTPHS